jgi:hypothetical protein
MYKHGLLTLLGARRKQPWFGAVHRPSRGYPAVSRSGPPFPHEHLAQTKIRAAHEKQLHREGCYKARSKLHARVPSVVPSNMYNISTDSMLRLQNFPAMGSICTGYKYPIGKRSDAVR